MHHFFKKKYFKILLSIAFFLIAFAFSYFQRKNNSIELVKNNLQKEIIKKEKSMDLIFQNLISFYSNNKSWNSIQQVFPEKLFENEGFVFIIFENTNLIFWSDNSVPLSKIDILDKSKILKLENGWYRIINKKIGKYTIIGLTLIKNEFSYQNDYLINNFNKDFNIPIEIGLSFEKNKYSIFTNSKDFLFSIQENSSIQISDKCIYIILILCIIGFILFCSFLYDVYENLSFLKKYNLLKFLLFIIGIFIIRSFIFYLNFPNILYDSKLFSPIFYAVSAYLPSLGDLLINASILLFLAFKFFTKVKLENHLQKATLLHKYIFAISSLFTIIILFYYYVVICKSIVIDSSIQMIMSDIFELTYESIVGSIVIFALSVSFILLTVKLFLFSRLVLKKPQYLFFSFIFSSFFFFILPFPVFWKEGFFYPLFFLIYILILFIFEYYKSYILIFQQVIIYILFFSFFSTFTFYKYNDSKEIEKRKLLVQRMSAENDPIAEYLFKGIMQEIKSDTLIINKIRRFNPEDSIINYIKSKYFKGYLGKYSEQITLCKDFQTLILKPNNYKVNCDKYFYDKITMNGFPTQTENFYSLDYGGGGNSYIALIRYLEDAGDSLLRTSVYIEMDAKFVSKDLGYPELLIDKKLNLLHNLSVYSYAKYVNRTLVKRYGKCFYENKLNKISNQSGFYIYDSEGFNHVLYKVNNRIDYIISKPKVDLIERIAPFTNIFIAFCFFFSILGFSTSYFRKLIPLVFNFKTRLQISILTIILISFIIIGTFTLIYISKLNNDKNSDILAEKTHSVLVELENKLGNEQYLSTYNTNQITELLVKLSNVFFTDINLFDVNGKLIASSRMQIFEEGLISKQMNTNALNNFANLGKTQFVDKECIGKHEYLSSYLPFRNNENKLIAYINLPYFAKQSDLKREISSFLKAYLNIYLFLIIISVIIALLISNYITRPLKLIIENLRQIKLGKKNKKIEWDSNDEIGNLIIEYNSMIDQLSISAEKLAKSEREVAWQEMAKQVAHEIKNPLTPMKLSIQHLQRAWNDKVPDWDDKLKRLTNTIIEQIDSLSLIASEFSDFAKMPRSDYERVNISSVLINTINLYLENDQTKVKFIYSIPDNCNIYADKKQMIRVFNNLIKNALQAFFNIENGVINISLEILNDSFLIKIADNGIGIDINQHNKIFSPYFTTKSDGTGLGLAMVKSIIESSGGTIWFESDKSTGTIFFIKLNKYTE